MDINCNALLYLSFPAFGVESLKPYSCKNQFCSGFEGARDSTVPGERRVPHATRKVDQPAARRRRSHRPHLHLLRDHGEEHQDNAGVLALHEACQQEGRQGLLRDRKGPYGPGDDVQQDQGQEVPLQGAVRERRQVDIRGQ